MTVTSAYQWAPIDQWRVLPEVLDGSEEEPDSGVGCILIETGKPVASPVSLTTRRLFVECKAYPKDSPTLAWAIVDAAWPIVPTLLLDPAFATFARSDSLDLGPLRVLRTDNDSTSESMRYAILIGSNVPVSETEANDPEAEQSSESAIAPTWLVNLYQDNPPRASRASIRVVLQESEQLLMSREFNKIDALLDGADFTRLPSELVLGLIRSFSIARGALLSWTHAVRRAEAEFDRRGLPASEMMVGLLDKVDNFAD